MATTSLADAQALYAARQAANNPTLALNATSTLMNIANSFLAHDNGTAYLITQATPQMFLSSAQGPLLDQKLPDYGASRNQGTPSTATVVFKVPVAASSTITIPAGTIVSTIGDGITTFATAFATQAATSISSGATVSAAVSAVSTANGSAANVAAGSITVLITQVGGGVTVSNAVADGGTAATGGTDPASDAQARAAGLANIVSKYGQLAVQSAILAVPGVFDAYVLDPQDGTGTISYYFCDINRAQVLATTGTVAAAVGLVLPPNITATGHVFSSIQNVSAITVKYDAPAAIKGTPALDAAIKVAVVAYLQSLAHNQVPTAFGMAQYVNNASGVGGVLTNFVIVSSTPTISGATAANTTIWGCSGGTSVVTVTHF